MRNVIAVDLGASSGRVIRVSLEGEKLEIQEIYRFPNEGIYVGDRFQTDILYMFHEMIKGLQKAYREKVVFEAIGIDCWGVDFGLLDACGELMGNPYHYRDSQSEGMMEKAAELFGPGEIFCATGVQDVWYNTIYQILGIMNRNPGRFWSADMFLMLPDLLGYFLTGAKSLEYTSVSTTQMFCLKERAWSKRVLEGLKINSTLFPKVLMTGKTKGMVTPRMKGIIGIPADQELPLIATAEHDSASAAYAVPAEEEAYVFINSGTWSIIGMILDEPIINEDVYERYFSNEGAAFGKVKLVKTIMGMWLIQELRKDWQKRGLNCEYEFLMRGGKAFSRMIDVDDAIFKAPENMEAAINRYCRETGQSEMEEQGDFYRTVMESLAFKYRESVDELEKLTGKEISTVYLLGGAVQDEAFCQYIANATGKAVSAGPVEATAVGNGLIQLKALGAVEDEEQAARIIRNSFAVKKYWPKDGELWDRMYGRYREITGGV